MVTFAEVRCFSCENSFPVYWHDWNKNLPIGCPFCSARFSEEQTERLKYVLGTASEMNGYFRKRNQEYGDDLFQVDFKHVFVPLEKYRLDQE